AGGRYLTAHGLATLRAVTARFVPGPPDDPDPGALDAGAAEAIDLYLAAFTFTPPLIHAGGPFSDRAGATHDDFADFVPLDAQAELGWRIRIEGSQGLAAREFAGPVTGLQQLYREGMDDLARLARRRAAPRLHARSGQPARRRRGAGTGRGDGARRPRPLPARPRRRARAPRPLVAGPGRVRAGLTPWLRRRSSWWDRA